MYFCKSDIGSCKVLLLNERGAMKDEGSQVAYRDNHGNIISGVVVGYDNHLRYLVRVSGSGKFDPLAIVSESNLVH